MGTRGPAPTPTPIMELRGSWRAKERAGEPRLPTEVPSCPAFLGTEAKAEWRRQTRLLARMGCITQADRACLAAYCDAWGEFVALAKQAEADGCSDLKLLKAKGAAAERVVRIAQQFGFTPSSRVRVRASGGDAERTDDGKARFFSTAN